MCVCAQRLGVQELTQLAADTLRQIDKQTKQSRKPVRPVTKAATTTTRSRVGRRPRQRSPSWASASLAATFYANYATWQVTPSPF